MATKHLALIGTAVAVVVAMVVLVVVLSRSKSSALVTTANSPSTSTIRETVTMPALPQQQITLPASTITSTVTATVTPGAASAFGEGIYKVGTDIPAGRLKTAGSDFCYYARLKNDSGDFNAIIANNNLSGPGTVSVKSGEFFEVKGTCQWAVTK